MLHRGYDIWITDDEGRRMPEYKMEVEGHNGKTVACYIPSESGKRFAIHWKDYNGLHTSSMSMVVDGTHRVGNVCRPNDHGHRIGIRTDHAEVYHPFQFAALRTTDDDSALLETKAHALEKLGTIEVNVTRVHSHVRRAAFRPQAFSGVGAVHERSKKLGAHCVTLGEGVRVRRLHGRCKSRPLDPREGPYATFTFRYRPAALLQAQGIMPPPAPEAGPSLAKHEKVQAGNKVKTRSEARVQVKSEAADVIELSDDDYPMDRKPSVRVKRELGRRTRVKPDLDDVIDLTLDD
ncbi:hypothetical protein C8Q70DRAFT_980345 [Cubamyces menziesii]|nr:hypothetical protein C8Q70DRAFT_980345 [Cubamyces menziesii]